MKRAGPLVSVAAALALLAGCGGYNKSRTATTTSGSGIKKRVLVSNAGPFELTPGCNGGDLCIIDASTDTISFYDSRTGTFFSFTIGVGTAPGKMVTASGTTLVVNTGENSISAVSNSQEAQLSKIGLPGSIDDVAITPDGKTGVAAVRNTNTIYFLDIAKAQVTGTVHAPTVDRLVMSHNGTSALAFSDSGNSAFVINISKMSAAAITGFDRPVFGVFSSDDSKAYIMDCGPECGGTSAGITVLDMSASPPVPKATVALSSASIGLLNGTTLYVAGTPNATGSGTLNVIDTGSMAVTTPDVSISSGFHDQIALGSNNKLFIGAENSCAGVCLSIFDTSAKKATVGNALGDVTGIQPISNRNVVYVAEGGEVVIYDSTTDMPVSPQPIDVVGKALDVLQIDP